MYILSLIICISLSLLYTWLILFIVRQWESQRIVKPTTSFIQQTKFSVVVAARNEQSNIVKTINSILSCDYPKDLFEVIIVDDHSSDDTVQVLFETNHDDRVSIIQLHHETGKKAALSKGVNLSKYSHIVVTDADCMVPEDWLMNLAVLFQSSEAQFISGPVIIDELQDVCSAFQSLDAIGTVGVTQAGIQSNKWFMANGANMAFVKQAFLEISGFEENKNWASGDDMFLVEQFSQRSQTAYMKTINPVVTKAERSWSALYQQRIRWATKNKSYTHQGVRNTLGVVFLFNLCIVLFFVLAILLGSKWLILSLSMLVVKVIIDRIYLSKMTDFFNQRNAMNYYLRSTFIYIIYIVGVGVASLFIKNYHWKGRRVQ